MRAAQLRSFILAAALLGCGVVFAADGTDPCEKVGSPCKPGKQDLLGSVSVSNDHKPLGKVSVTAYLATQKSAAVVTDDHGSYSFDDLKPGVYSFVFEKAGFRRVTRDKIQVKENEGVLLNIEMEESRPFTLGPSPLHFSDF